MPQLSIISFTAPWCSACRAMKPSIDDLVNQYQTPTREVDVDQEKQFSIQSNVLSIPVIVFMKAGKEVDRVIGAQTKSFLEGKFKKWA